MVKFEDPGINRSVKLKRTLFEHKIRTFAIIRTGWWQLDSIDGLQSNMEIQLRLLYGSTYRDEDTSSSYLCGALSPLPHPHAHADIE